MSQTIEIAPHALSEGSTIRHATLYDEQTVVEISETSVRTTCGDQEFVYPREQLVFDLSAGRFEVVS